MSRRRITVVVDENGSSAMEGQGEVVVDLLPAAALGAWVYANRDSLGIEIELVCRRGVFVSPSQVKDGGNL